MGWWDLLLYFRSSFFFVACINSCLFLLVTLIVDSLNMKDVWQRLYLCALIIIITCM